MTSETCANCRKIMENDDVMFKEKDDEIKKLKGLLKNQKKLESEIRKLEGMIKILRFRNKESKENWLELKRREEKIKEEIREITKDFRELKELDLKLNPDYWGKNQND